MELKEKNIKSSHNFSIKKKQISVFLNFDSDIKCYKQCKNFLLKSYHCSNDINEFLNFNILEDIKDKIHNINLSRLSELLNNFGLSSSILDKQFSELSTSERKKVLLICALMSDKNNIFFDNPSCFLDYKSIECLVRELKRLKKEKTIIIESEDTEFALKVADEVYLVNRQGKVVFGDKYLILSNDKLLNSIGLEPPCLLSFINKVKQIMNIKLAYRDNINDTIKDVYRNA